MLPALLATALAAGSLDLAADVAEPGLRAWWREGELVVGAPERGDKTAMRPLVDLRPTTLPSDLSGWTELGAECKQPAQVELQLEGQTVAVTVAGPPESRAVFLRVGEEVRAQQALGRPVTPCDVHIGQADGLPGLELMVTWRFGEGSQQVRGLTVFRVAESVFAQPAPPALPKATKD